MNIEELTYINKILADNFDKIIALSTKEIVYDTSTQPNSINDLVQKLIKLKVKELNIKKNILKIIKSQQSSFFEV